MFVLLLLFSFFSPCSLCFGADSKLDSKDSNVSVDSKVATDSKVLDSKVDSKDSKDIESSVINTINTADNALLEEYNISTWRYFSVIFLMLGILAVLYFIRIKQNRGYKVSNIIVEQAKILDSKNKIAIIKYNEKSYILGLNPNGITLIDKIESKDAKDFSTMLDKATLDKSTATTKTTTTKEGENTKSSP